MKTSYPVLYYSLSANSKNAEKIIKLIHSYAKKQKFNHVSGVIVMEGDDLLKNDSFDLLREQSTGITINRNGICKIFPKKLICFAVQLPNKRIFTIGLSVFDEDDCNSLNARWHGFAHSFDNKFILDQNDCFESHKLVIDLLRYADSLNVLKMVQDQSGLWDSGKKIHIQVRDIFSCIPHMIDRISGAKRHRTVASFD